MLKQSSSVAPALWACTRLFLSARSGMVFLKLIGMPGGGSHGTVDRSEREKTTRTYYLTFELRHV